MNNVAPFEIDYRDRELFLYKIISGIVKIKCNGYTIRVYPNKVEDYLDSCIIYEESMQRYYAEGIKLFDDMVELMIDRDIWSWDEELEMKDIKKNIDDLKVDAYESRRDMSIVYKFKNQIYKLSSRYQALHSKKHMYFENTCEGLSSYNKLSFLIKRSSFVGKKRYDFSDLRIEDVIRYYNEFHLVDDSIIRYLARNEPWKTTWTLDKNIINNKGREMTMNQKTLLVYTKMYENVYESMDCPPDYIIDDDDLLDGWFISQSRTREQERKEKSFDQTIKSSKIKNAQEVFAVVKKDQVKEIESMNSPYSRSIKKQREEVLKNRKVVKQEEFPDEKLKMRIQANNQGRR